MDCGMTGVKGKTHTKSTIACMVNPSIGVRNVVVVLLYKHGKEKHRCKDCGGVRICDHGKQKYNCKKCGGGGICKHGKNRQGCKGCRGSGICKHDKYKQYCKDYGGSALYKTAHCTSCKRIKYKGHCLFCFVHSFPNEPVAQNYRTKEAHVTTFLKEKFPDVTWKCNKRVEDGCSKRRPDLLLEMGTRIVTVFINFNNHDGYYPTWGRLGGMCTTEKLYLFGSIPTNTRVKMETIFRHRGGQIHSVSSPYVQNGRLRGKPDWKP